ncbi:MAG: hypothetical protein IH934_04925 [Nanoarchaeota archaeon]|nr:hypothetical protein [Nanoarchaeota archaeon]
MKALQLKDIGKKNIKTLILFFIVLIVLTVVIKSLFFYKGIYFAPKKGVHDLDISIESIIPEFKDTFEKTEGIVLFDLSHENDFDNEEIDVLISRIIDRGNKVEFLTDAENLDSKLRKANSFVVILPKEEFSEKEMNLIKEFTDKKGKLLLVSDPDRENEINSISNNFNIIFSQDYLYNQKENDGNFKFIFLEKFKKNNITRKLKKIALYSSCPILPFENGIVVTDKNTFSSSDEAKTGFAPIALKNSILAVCDITFFNQPYNTINNNNQLISNIADFLTKPEKEFNLADFPYFFEKATIVTTNLDLSKHAINLKNRLLKADIDSNIKRNLNKSVDNIVIELFDDFNAIVIENLAVDEDSFRINDLLFNRKDSSLVHLSKNNVTILTILADNEEILERTLGLLDTEEIRNNLVDDNLAVISGLEVQEEEEEEEEEE